MNTPKHVEFDGSRVVPFDIETTGFEINSKLTTITTYLDGTYFIYINNEFEDIDDVDSLESTLDRSVDDTNIKICEGEQNVLEEFSSDIEDITETYDYYLVAYNGERWRGGFDLSFLRTVAQRHGMDNLFSGRYYIDLYPIFDKGRINTVGPSLESINTDDKKGYRQILDYAEYHHKDLFEDNDTEEVVETVQGKMPRFSKIRDWYQNRSDYIDLDKVPTKQYKDLVMVHYLLSVSLTDISEEEYLSNDIDPFNDSVEAVQAFEDGNIEELVLHNVADVQKTLELSQYLDKISMDDVSWKQLV